jgi:outer membrane protein OmpA-like peptidoglycan-associated protein
VLSDREPALPGDPERAPQPASAPRPGHRESTPDSDLRPLLSAGNRAVAGLVQRFATGPGAGGGDLPARLAAEAGRGQPLPEPVRRDLESGTGAALDGVQIHTDSAADGLARDLGARALTTGRDIYFRSGAYRPDSDSGYRLLAHEATHVLQQRTGAVDAGPAAGVSVSHPGDAAEQAAEVNAGALLRARGGQPAEPATAPAPSPAGLPGRHTVQRFSGFEHESLGDATGTVIDLGDGITLSWGQVVAVAGDEVASVEDLQAMVRTPAGRQQLRAALEHAELRKPITSALPPAGKDEREKQTSTYIGLAMKNVAHFAGGGTALDTWRGHHARALQSALTAGLSGNAAEFENAQLIEAFGQHFLTDMFSGGHIRTPRAEVLAYHADLAPAMAAAFVANMRTRLENYLVAQIMLQIGTGFGPPGMQAPPGLRVPSIRGPLAQDKAREEVKASVDKEINDGLAKIGGMPALVEMFGQAMAGAVSGPLHDRDGDRGVMVASADHPAPWLAKGDSKLDEAPGPMMSGGSVSRDQADKAVRAGREQLLAARAAGQRETVIAQVAPADPPTALVVHFAFGSAAIGDGASEVAAAAAYLHLHPNTQVALVGHTDQVGTDDANLDLGRRRAEAVRAALVAGGAWPDQVTTTSLGESSPVTGDPKQYGANRRVEFTWQSRLMLTGPGTDEVCVDPIRQRAQAVIDSFGPPYAAVERHIPYEVPFLNEPLPEWRWGKMSPEIIADVDKWIRNMVGKPANDLVTALPETMMASGYTFTVRALLQQMIGELMAAPAQTLGRLIGRPPG